MIATCGVMPCWSMSDGNGTMLIAGPEASASKVQYWLLPTLIETVEGPDTSAQAKTASTGYWLLRTGVDEPDVQTAAFGWILYQKTTWSMETGGGEPVFHQLI